MLRLDEGDIVAFKPVGNIVGCDKVFLLPDRSSVYVLDCFMNERSEHHSVLTDRHKLQFFVELVL